MLFLSFLTGAVHVLAPDHWFPASVLTWQKHLNQSRTLLFSFSAFLIHLSLGAILFFIFFPFFSRVNPHTLFPFTLILLFSGLLLRLSRFSRIEEVLRSGSSSNWGYFAVISLLGPCESLIPVLIKASQSGGGYILPFLAYFLGTILSGTTLILVGRLFLNRPLLFSQSLSWAYQRSAALPVVMILVVGLSYLFRIA